jgi:hypothetical protein
MACARGLPRSAQGGEMLGRPTQRRLENPPAEAG